MNFGLPKLCVAIPDKPELKIEDCPPPAEIFVAVASPFLKSKGFLKYSIFNRNGWGGRIRTSECRNQNPVSYHLTTPQCVRENYPKIFIDYNTQSKWFNTFSEIIACEELTSIRKHGYRPVKQTPIIIRRRDVVHQKYCKQKHPNGYFRQSPVLLFQPCENQRKDQTRWVRFPTSGPPVRLDLEAAP